MARIPQYTKDAINRYNAKFDRLAVNLPKGTKERIKALTGKSGNAYITALVLDDLDRLEGIKGTVEPEEIPNAETLAAFQEIDEMKANGTGQAFDNLDDLWKSLED